MTHKSKKLPIAFIASIALFALVSVFGISIFTGNKQDSNIKNSSASATEPADYNNDNLVNGADLSLLLANWNTTNTNYDINKDGTVGPIDLSMMLTRWGSVAVAPGTTAGAQLPITYDINSLTGTKRFVATNGNDTTGNGTISAPYATLTKAESMSLDGDKIIIRGGTYQIPQRTVIIVDKTVSILAYPGEIPVFDGSIAAPTTVSTEGLLRYFNYQPIPARSGNGLGLTNMPTATFSGTTPTGLAADRGWRCITGTNTYTAPTTPTGCLSPKLITGYYPDQVWVNGVQLIQVADKALVGPGKFFVARIDTTDLNPAPTSLYMHQDDTADMSKVRVSYSGGSIQNGNSQGEFVRLNAPNIRIEGIKVFGHSSSWDSSGIRLMTIADNSVIKNVELDSVTSQSVNSPGTNANFVSNLTLENITITRTSWMGMGVSFNDGLSVLNTKINNTNSHQEIGAGPTSGAIKLSKARGTKVVGSEMNNNYGHTLWFDQSCTDTIVANSRFVDNSHAGVFYEISHNILIINNYIKTSSANAEYLVRLAASSGVKLVNNTIVGGTRTSVGIMVDGRTKKYDSDNNGTPDRYCSEHALRYGQPNSPSFETACINGMTSDLQTGLTGRYGVTNQTLGLNFQPSIDIMQNNIIVSNTTQICGLLCVYGYSHWKSGSSWVDASVMMDSIFHQARIQTIEDPSVAATSMNGNVYQITSGNIANFNSGYTDINAGTGANFVAVDQRPGATFTATTLIALRNALAASPYSLSVESAGVFANSGLTDSNGNPTGSLDHNQAIAIPTDSAINQYIPAGTKHYGALSQ